MTVRQSTFDGVYIEEMVISGERVSLGSHLADALRAEAQAGRSEGEIDVAGMHIVFSGVELR